MRSNRRLVTIGLLAALLGGATPPSRALDLTTCCKAQRGNQGGEDDNAGDQNESGGNEQGILRQGDENAGGNDENGGGNDWNAGGDNGDQGNDGGSGGDQGGNANE